MMSSKVIYTGHIEHVQYAKNLGGKSRKNLVEHQIIKNEKKIL